jgi:hypothetical protein
MRAWRTALGMALVFAGGAKAQDLPPGAPCTDRLDRYQAVVGADHRTGNVNESVYSEIEHELSRAAAACAAGQDGAALSLIRQSEARHGYHT